jgi:hypothetical protein
VTARVANGGLALEATTEVGIGRYDVGGAAANTGPTEASWMRTLSTLASARLHVTSGSSRGGGPPEGVRHPAAVDAVWIRADVIDVQVGVDDELDMVAIARRCS